MATPLVVFGVEEYNVGWIHGNAQERAGLAELSNLTCHWTDFRFLSLLTARLYEFCHTCIASPAPHACSGD